MKRTLSLILSLLMVLSMFTGLSIGAQSVGVGSQDDPHTALAGTGAQDVIARSATRESGDVAIPQKGDADLADTGDETINSVGVNGIVVPTTGATPTYSASVPYGEEYQIKTDYWTNGVWWFNETDGETMTASDTFEAGKNYTATVLLKTINDRISFASNVSAYLNYQSAKVYNYGDGKIAVYRTFTCHDAIDYFHVIGVTEPVAGASPVFSASVPSGKSYHVYNYGFLTGRTA